MNYVDAIAMLALLQFLFFGTLVGQARGKYKVKAPAISGSEPFERIYRVQMNTMEMLIVFLPALYVAARYWPGHYIAAIGAVFIIGRFVYWRAYVSDPATRGLGFLLTMLPTFALLLIGLVPALLGKAPV